MSNTELLLFVSLLCLLALVRVIRKFLKNIFKTQKIIQNHKSKSVGIAKLYFVSFLASITWLKKYFVSIKSFWSGGSI